METNRKQYSSPIKHIQESLEKLVEKILSGLTTLQMRLQVATAITRGAFEYQGQKCSAASRAYIPASMWEAVKGALDCTS